MDYLKLTNPETIQYTKNFLVNNSCIYRKYYIGQDSPETRALATIISKALEQPFYTEMRTNQQLGYIVWSYSRNYDEMHYLNFLIQSGVYAADELNKRVDGFISNATDIIKEMDQETFQQLIDSAIEQLEKKPMSISERAIKLKNFIFEHDRDFDRDKKTIEALRGLDKNLVAGQLSNIISPESRKLVNILTFAENHENKSKVKDSFSSLESWKSTRTYE